MQVLDQRIGSFAPGSDQGSLRHSALVRVEEGDAPLDQTRLTDRQCLAVVLQGAALWSHLEHGGWYLPEMWDSVRVTHDGLLRVATLQRGDSRHLVQTALRRLLHRLFRANGTIVGRGEARRAGRYLDGQWRQILAPSNADKAIEEIFEAAPFLWQDAFAPARLALVAEHAAEHASHRETHFWLAGPGAIRRRIFERAERPEAAWELLASSDARDLWEGWRRGSDPNELAQRRRWREAVATWRREPPRDKRAVLRYARCLFALGRYSQTLLALQRQHHVDARLLRARAQWALGELNATQATVRRLAEAEMSTEQTLELVDIAIRLAAARRQTDEVREWVARGLAETRGKARLSAMLLAADGAWDCGDLAAMGHYLEETRQALDDPELAGQWHRRRGLLAMEEKDGARAVEHVSAALRLDRRQLLPAEAGRLWNELAVSRVLANDLEGATRAAQHAQRLMQDCDGPSRTTLALYNLAEVNLRRGRTAGVESTLECSTAENRRSGNLRGLVRDLELWVRLELAQGRAAAALARCTEAFLQLDQEGSDERREVLEVLAARAHGWLGQQQQAAACLRRGPEKLLDLEPEERPAVCALAGEVDRARTEAAGTRWASLWTALSSGTHPPSSVWAEVETLEPYRAARLIFDCELVFPGVVPPRRVRNATVTLKECGAQALVEKLENQSLSSWRAVERYLSCTDRDLTAASELLTTVGFDEVSLSWVRNGQEEVVLSGPGGSEQLTASTRGGTLLLRAPFVDNMLRVIFMLIQRDFEPPKMPEIARKKSPDVGGIVGESPGLRKALTRLDALAKDDLPILILGESGTGKELMAQRAHRMSSRANGPFVAINCAELSESLTQSDLFGHVKGSFTGADRDRPGVFESAHSGTIFLDEIGDLPLAAQGKMLRVLQEGEIRRIGESFARKIDVRVITATHRDLEQRIARQDFRQDLFFRLKVAKIELPPLRERHQDIHLLADHFLAGRKPAGRLSDEARKLLASYHWPGNVRELRNVLQVAATLATGRAIRAEDLELPSKVTNSKGGYHQLLEQYRKDLLSTALSATGGNRAAAARRLGMTRQALSYLVKQLGLS